MARLFIEQPLSRRQFQALVSSGLLSVATSGCGTILHPERIGQPRGPLDWKIVALDTLGLLLFFVPGVVAFAVDFYNGTIFLPTGYAPPNYFAVELSNRVPLGKGPITLQKIEQTVYDELEIELDLQPGTYVTRELESLEQYAAVSRQIAADVERGNITLRCQSPEVGER